MGTSSAVIPKLLKQYLRIQASNIHCCVLIPVSSMLTYEICTDTRCDTTTGYGSHGSDPEQARQRVLSS